MSEFDLAKRFEPKPIEERWGKWWADQQFFRADAASSKPPFTVCIPPPNVTGRLHAGHALGLTLQDTLTRWKRMAGFEALYVPGTDHAGIGTQTVVEKHLLRTEGKRRTEYTREEFLKKVWAWKEEYQANIDSQLRALGTSVDWTRYAFTLDEPRYRAVMYAFWKLYGDGLIYKGDYVVNWDPGTGTALADDEVEYSDQEGQLWHLKYPLTDDPAQFAVVATTRPETMLGDVAVAVNPADERYKSWVGKTVTLPLVNRQIPIIADDFVDAAFGSGMVKITPAHDPNDFQCGLRHDLPRIVMMTPEAVVNEHGGPYQGLDRFAARERVVEDLKKLGLLLKVEKHQNRIGKSYRSGSIIEPYLSKQWFVKMAPLAEKARRAVRSEDGTAGPVALIPQTWESTYFHWMNNVRDWCISRQLWWGHRIPVFTHKQTGKIVCTRDGNAPDASGQWEQDPDVLDTWFSSWLWPMSTLGWPEKELGLRADDHPDFKKFYPTSVLVTGHDILFFWVARMIMAGCHFTGEAPFSKTPLTGLIFGKSYFREKEGKVFYVTPEEREKCEAGEVPKGVEGKWEKMSKSKGNVIDPLDMIDSFGCDAVRLTLLAYCAQGRNIDLDRQRFEGYRNFANKLWNAARLVLDRVKDRDAKSYYRTITKESRAALPLEDRWILSRLAEAAEKSTKALEEFRFDEVVSAIYQFVWGDFCDWYIEFTKQRTTGDSESGNQARTVLLTVLETIVRLLHPACPFLTEEIWQKIKQHFVGAEDLYAVIKAPSICKAAWPGGCVGDAGAPISAWRDAAAESAMAQVQNWVGAIRNIRGEMGVQPADSVDLIVETANLALINEFRAAESLLRSSIRLIDVTYGATNKHDDGLLSMAVVGEVTLRVPLPARMVAAEKERLTKELGRLDSEAEKIRAKLSNESFVGKAPEAVVARERERLAGIERDAGTLRERISGMKV